ncbi:MAG TPA: folylpolyglutamate synthase/dihydrofolate synthase family protein [Geobacteraceae bacterium]|nr:folylpolyglutamate synthase/dihydrofolate synthase family protein [Geobacteraceae bacterium]
MTYQETITYLYGLGRFGIKPGLGRTRSILKALSNPQDGLRVVHVAGTNGKGSTASFLASILAAGGYKTGLFTSPHLIGFTERIRINGIEIDENDVVSTAGRVLAAAPPGATFFEIVTAMAFLYFAENGANPVVMETGMGGRFDATNVSPKIMSLITPISLDHCEYLGDSISGIAREKAGIIEPGKPVIVSSQPEEALAVIREACEQSRSPLFCFGRQFNASWRDSGLYYRGQEWELAGLKPGIPGRYQSENAAVALRAAELLAGLGYFLDEKVARSGLERASWPGRMEMLGGSPRILLDGAHNPAGAAALAESLADVQRNRLILVVGVMSNKDLDGMVAALAPLADRVLAVTPTIARALSSSGLAARWEAAGVTATDAGTVAAGLEIAAREAGPEDLVLVCGSLFTVGEARAILLSGKFEPFRG